MTERSSYRASIVFVAEKVQASPITLSNDNFRPHRCQKWTEDEAASEGKSSLSVDRATFASLTDWW
jgi:hypothetical protein